LNPRTRAFLQLPQGAESFYLEEAQRHEEILQHMRILFGQWGYLPVQTPVFDFYDIYRPFLDVHARETIYRLVDREGDLLMLRSDVTLFLAKQIGMIISHRDLPIRVWYADTILRHQDEEDISKNEFYQVGAELIGKSGSHADLEVLLLLFRSLETLKLTDYQIHIGSREVFNGCFDALDEDNKLKLLQAISLRDFEKVHTILEEEGFEDGKTAFFCRLFSSIGTLKTLVPLMQEGKKEGFLTYQTEKALQQLMDTFSILQTLGKEDLFRLDLSELGGQGYYTGIVFQAYKEGVDAAFASGGRYDNLLAHFGFSAPAVGFSIMLRKIEGFLPKEPVINQKTPIPITDSDFITAYRKAEEVRHKGGIALLGGTSHG